MNKFPHIKDEFLVHGIPASPGIAIGTALVLKRPETAIEEKSLAKEDVESEISRFRAAIDKTRTQILTLQNKVQAVLTEKDSKIFDAHLLILDDKLLTDEVEDTVRNELKNIDFVFNKTVQRYILAIATMPDLYFRERAADIKDVADRIIKNLHGRDYSVLDSLPGQRIVIAHDLKPSDTALLDKENVQAFATEVGSRTSHTAIMARSMQIPAIVGAQNLFPDVIDNGDLLIIDGYLGLIIVHPLPNTLEFYAQKEAKSVKFYTDLLQESRLRPETTDGFRVQLAANIRSPDEVDDVIHYGAAGVGLFRTEYLFIDTKELPDEEKQFQIYSSVASKMEGSPVIIRTADIGGDKLSEVITPFYEPNPFLGYRAIRLFLEYRQILKTQLRAIIRAGAFGNVKIMFPMISCAEEVDKLLEMVDEAKHELKKENLPFNENIKTGIMIETPSAAIISESLAQKVDFFSIGTNDLVQYTLAVDRTNERVAYLYQPTHPAILILIRKIISAAKKNRIWVSVCGEMASDPRYTPLLVGMGIHELSMNAAAIGPIRRLIRRMRMHEAEEVALKAMNCVTAKEALSVSEEFLNRIAPDIISMTSKGE